MNETDTSDPPAEHKAVIYVLATALLAASAGNFAFGRWLMSIARSAQPRT